MKLSEAYDIGDEDYDVLFDNLHEFEGEMLDALQDIREGYRHLDWDMVIDGYDRAKDLLR